MAEPENISLDMRLSMLVPHDYLAAASSQTERLILAVNYFKEQLDESIDEHGNTLVEHAGLLAQVRHLHQEVADLKKDLKRYTTLKLN